MKNKYSQCPLPNSDPMIPLFEAKILCTASCIEVFRGEFHFFLFSINVARPSDFNSDLNAFSVISLKT